MPLPTMTRPVLARLRHAQRIAARCAARALWVPIVWALAACSTTDIDETAGWSNEKLYVEARDEALASNFERSAQLFEKLEGRAAGSVLAQQAQLEQAYAYYRQGERAQALATIDRFMRLHPSSPALDYALYLRGLVNFNDNLGLFGRLAGTDLSERDQAAAKESFTSFRRIVEEYPSSRYAPDARQRMRYIVNSLAAYEVHVARYYFQRGAYLAAANRAQQALVDYDAVPALEEALFILVRAYDQLGMPELRDSAQRVLVANYPESRYLREGFVTAPRRWWQLW